MNDTNPKIAEKYIKLMKGKSNEDRLIMGCSMYDTAKRIVIDSIVNQNPGIPASKINEKLFLRFYDMDLSEPQKLFTLENIQKLL